MIGNRMQVWVKDKHYCTVIGSGRWTKVGNQRHVRRMSMKDMSQINMNQGQQWLEIENASPWAMDTSKV
jgi:hypothetical protein